MKKSNSLPVNLSPNPSNPSGASIYKRSIFSNRRNANTQIQGQKKKYLYRKVPLSKSLRKCKKQNEAWMTQ